MADGEDVTVKVLVAMQPVLSVYVIIAVPGVRPVTKPNKVITGATAPLLLLQVPPPGDDIVVVEPTQITDGPTIGVGNG
jgi:hypothetical protein